MLLVVGVLHASSWLSVQHLQKERLKAAREYAHWLFSLIAILVPQRADTTVYFSSVGLDGFARWYVDHSSGTAYYLLC